MKNEEKNQILQPEIEEMLSAGVHFGVRKTLLHQSMKDYIIEPSANVKNIYFYDLEKTLSALQSAGQLIGEAIKKGKKILLVGIQPAAQQPIEKMGETLNLPYLNYKWPGGFLTNFQTIKARVIFYQDLKAKKEAGEFEKLNAYERNRLERQLTKLEQVYRGVVNLEDLPDYLFIVDLRFKNHRTAFKEARKLAIPVISISGLDNDVRDVFLVIPGNDKAPKSISYMIDYLIKIIQPLTAKEESPAKEELQKQEVGQN